MRPFERETVVAVAFTFGWMAASTSNGMAIMDGSLAALADELSARGVLADLMSRFDPEMTARLMQAVTLDRAAGRKSARR